MSDVSQTVGEELEQIAGAPATFSNKMFVTIIGDNAKLTFAEKLCNDLHVRSAHLVSLSDLAQLRDLIGMMLEHHATGAGVPVTETRPPLDS